MNAPPRTHPQWSGRLAWVLPASIGLVVIGYLVFYQAAIKPARPAAVFWGELLVFGIAGPLAARYLLQQLARDAVERRAAAAQIRALMAEERHRTDEWMALHAVSTAMSQALNEEGALSAALAQVIEVVGLAAGKIYRWNPETNRFALAAAHGEPALLNKEEVTIAPGECLCGIAALSGDPQQAIIGPGDARLTGPCQAHAGRPCATVPIPAKDRTLGVLHVLGQPGTAFADADMALLRSVAAQIGIAVENMRLREEVRRAEALSTLIQEMHHRIKNNLQTVADLLSLEMSASPSPAARKSLRDSISRIKSIAAVHELLSLEQLRLTDITELARQVCDISLKHLTRPDRQVIAEINGPAIYLPSKQATALALVMNELIANALEHAFGLHGQEGRLTITTVQEGAQVTVTVTDNGRGLSPDFDLAARRGMGLQIARTLVEKDLAGSLRLQNSSEGGTQATLTFYK